MRYFLNTNEGDVTTNHHRHFNRLTFPHFLLVQDNNREIQLRQNYRVGDDNYVT